MASESIPDRSGMARSNARYASLTCFNWQRASAGSNPLTLSGERGKEQKGLMCIGERGLNCTAKGGFDEPEMYEREDGGK